MALAVGRVNKLNNVIRPFSSSHCLSSRWQDIDFAFAGKQTSRASFSMIYRQGAKVSRLEVWAARPKKASNNHVEHHKEAIGESKPVLPPKLELKWLNNGGELTGLKMEELVLGGHGIMFGSRIPKHYFLVKGFGETDQGDGSDPWETGSYDLALEDAGIQDLNILKYTSVLPPESEPVSALEAKPFLRHGAAMESIMSVMHGVKGDRITAGVGRVQIRRKKDNFHIGGYAAEYEGHASAEVAKDILKKDLDGIFHRRFADKEYECFEEDFTIQEGEITKSFGSVLAAICFVTYVTPAYSCA
ncbi:unnamed protein product [Calypogeia fissa]